MKHQLFVINKKPTKRINISERATVLVVVHSDEKNSKTLHDLLKALKLNMDSEVAFVTLSADEEVHLSSYLTHNISRILVFGITPQQIGFQINTILYKFLKLENLVLLFSESIAALNADKNKKIALWKELQTEFK